MDIAREHKEDIEKIMSEMTCSKDFKCVKSAFENSGRTRDIGMKTFIECLEQNPEECEFSFPFGYQHFCRCPLRVYLSKKLKI